MPAAASPYPVVLPAFSHHHIERKAKKMKAMEQREVRYISSLYGGFWSFDVKDFCYMTNPYFPPQEFIDSLGTNLRELVKSYPSTNWYISSLVAQPLGLTHDEIVIANGASELIAAITDRFVDNLAVPIPTFDEFINRARSEIEARSATTGGR